MTLLTPREVDGLHDAEVHMETFTSGRKSALWGHRPTLVYVPGGLTREPDLYAEKHMKVCLGVVADERLRMVSVAGSPEAVIAAAEAGLMEVVLVACRWREGRFDEVEQALAVADITLMVIRQRSRPGTERVHRAVNPLVARLAGMGLNEAQITEALAIPREQVRSVLRVIRDARAHQPLPAEPAIGWQVRNVDELHARRARRRRRQVG